MFTRIILAFCLLFPSFSFAQGVNRTERKVLLDAVHANVAAASRTFVWKISGGSTSTIGSSGYNLAVLHFNMDYTDGTTAVGMVCSASDDSGTTLYVMQDCSIGAGLCTSSDASWAKAISAADAKWVWRVDATGYQYLSCVVTCTGGTANEHISVSGYLTTK